MESDHRAEYRHQTDKLQRDASRCCGAYGRPVKACCRTPMDLQYDQFVQCYRDEICCEQAECSGDFARARMRDLKGDGAAERQKPKAGGPCSRPRAGWESRVFGKPEFPRCRRWVSNSAPPGWGVRYGSKMSMIGKAIIVLDAPVKHDQAWTDSIGAWSSRYGILVAVGPVKRRDCSCAPACLDVLLRAGERVAKDASDNPEDPSR